MWRRGAAIALTGIWSVAAGCGEVAPAGEGADDADALATTTTTRPVLPDGACVARMSDPSPPQGGTETVIVDSHHPSRAVKVTVHYKSKDSVFSGQTDGTGHAEVEFAIGKPTANHTVVVDVDVDGAEACQASFTPTG